MGACGYFKQKDKQANLLARAGEKELFTNDVIQSIPANIDSTGRKKIIRELVHKWVEDQALLQKAELNLSEEQKSFEAQIEDYRRSLIIYAFEQKLIQQKLDTHVSMNEITAYYEAKPENFQLKDYVLKARFLKVDEDGPKLKKVRAWLISSDEKELELLEDYCIQFTSSYLLEDKWIHLSDLLDIVPLEVIDPGAFLSNTKFKEVYSPPFRYMMYIYDYRLKNTLSPLQIEKNRIRNTIINERRMNLLKEMRNGIVQEALNKKQIEVFVK